VALDLDDLEELLEHVGTLPGPEHPRTLKGTVLFPSGDALVAEELAAVLTLHRVLEDL
jgi:hypothetical protein